LKERDLTVIRIPNNEIWKNFNGVCEYIDDYIKRNTK
jgi:very-short-patch-repair endonuclease